MEVRITYRSEIYIKGDSLQEIKQKWEALNIDPVDREDPSVTDYGFIETISVEDAGSYKEIPMEEFDTADIDVQESLRTMNVVKSK